MSTAIDLRTWHDVPVDASVNVSATSSEELTEPKDTERRLPPFIALEIDARRPLNNNTVFSQATVSNRLPISAFRLDNIDRLRSEEYGA